MYTTNSEQVYTSLTQYPYFDINKFLDYHEKTCEYISFTETDTDLPLYSASGY